MYLFKILINSLFFSLIIKQCLCLCSPNLCVLAEKCSNREVKGNWCNWSPWSSCEQYTCSRLRQRICACPRPSNFKKDLLCESTRFQKDIKKDRTIIRHTRLERRTITGKICNIPFYKAEEYNPDCYNIGNKYYCLTHDNIIEQCNLNKTSKMFEEDVSACDGWEKVKHWILSKKSNVPKAQFDTDSDLGKMCAQRTPFESKTGCIINLYFSKTTRSDYGRLINLAYDLNSCRLACAIHPHCQSFDYFSGYKCTLNIANDIGNIPNEDLMLMPGNLHEKKPYSCIRIQKSIESLDKYEFSSVVDIIEAIKQGL